MKAQYKAYYFHKELVFNRLSLQKKKKSENKKTKLFWPQNHQAMDHG